MSNLDYMWVNQRSSTKLKFNDSKHYTKCNTKCTRCSLFFASNPQRTGGISSKDTSCVMCVNTAIPALASHWQFSNRKKKYPSLDHIVSACGCLLVWTASRALWKSPHGFTAPYADQVTAPWSTQHGRGPSVEQASIAFTTALPVEMYVSCVWCHCLVSAMQSRSVSICVWSLVHAQGSSGEH